MSTDYCAKLYIGVRCDRADFFQDGLMRRCSQGHTPEDAAHEYCPKCGQPFVTSAPEPTPAFLAAAQARRLSPELLWGDLVNGDVNLGRIGFGPVGSVSVDGGRSDRVPCALRLKLSATPNMNRTCFTASAQSLDAVQTAFATMSRVASDFGLGGRPVELFLVGEVSV